MNVNTFQRRLRWSSVFIGGVFLLWLPIEDQTLIFVTILAAAICLWGGIALKQKWKVRPIKYPWIGLCAGGGVGPVSFLLMVFKVGLHSHSKPDFSSEQLFGLIKISPAWGIAGFLVGLALYLYAISRKL